MATVKIPPRFQKLTGGTRSVDVPGATLQEVIDALDELYPGIGERIVEDGKIRPGLAAAVDSVIGTRGLQQPVGEKSEIAFVPAISGG